MASTTPLEKQNSVDHEDNNIVLLNFHENPELIQLPHRFQDRKDGLKMLLSSGDWVINHVPNIDANPDYDIHVCLPEPASTPKNDIVNPLQSNINSILDNPEFRKKKLICYVDYGNPAEMTEFCRVFNGRISQLGTLDNRILPDTNQILSLLCDGGRVIRNIAAKLDGGILSLYFRPVPALVYKNKNDYIKYVEDQPGTPRQALGSNLKKSPRNPSANRTANNKNTRKNQKNKNNPKPSVNGTNTNSVRNSNPSSNPSSNLSSKINKNNKNK